MAQIHRMVFLVLLALMICCQRNKSDSERPDNMNDYLRKNYENSDWFNGMLPERLKDLKGKIKKLDQKEYFLNDDKTALELTSGTPTFTLIFNDSFEIIEERGNWERSIITYKNYIEKKMLTWKWFDDDKNLIQIEIYQYDDSSGFATNLYLKSTDGTEERRTFTIQMLNDHAFIYHGRYFDDRYENNKLVESKANYASLAFKYEYNEDYYVKYRYSNERLSDVEKFNPADYLIEITTYGDKALPTWREKRKYDSRHNLVEKVTDWIDKGSQETITYAYDESNLLVEEKQFSGGLESPFIIRYTYDKHGNFIQKSNDKLVEMRYTYDDVGNWIERQEVKGTEVLRKAVREIEYFD